MVTLKLVVNTILINRITFGKKKLFSNFQKIMHRLAPSMRHDGGKTQTTDKVKSVQTM